MSRFKVGDRVECVNNKNYNELTIGKLYDVLEVDCMQIMILSDDGITLWSYEERFVLVEYPQKPLEAVQHTSEDLNDRNIKNDLKNRIATYELIMKAKDEYIAKLEGLLRGGLI